MKKEILIKAVEKIRRGIVRFLPFHLCAVAVAVLMVLANHNVIGDTTMLNCARGLYTGALAGVFWRLMVEWRESRRPKGHTPCRARVERLLAWPVTAAVGALGVWFWYAVGEETPRYLLWTMLYAGMVISIFALCVAVLSRLTDENSLFSRLTLNALAACGNTMLFTLSLILCLLAFDKLIYKVDDKLYLDFWVCGWAILAPVGMLALLPERGENESESDRAVAFLFWILLPASLLLLAILYLYLGRIVITRSMPSGELNWFGSIALAAYVFFWLSLRGSTRRFFRLFIRWGWASLLPVLAMQLVGIAIRYHSYGLTAPRYAGMITLSFGMVALILAAFKRGSLGLFIYIAVAGLIFTVSPLNIIDVPIRNQEARLKAVLEKTGLLKGDELLPMPPDYKLSDEDARVVVGAWNYLVSNGFPRHFSRKRRDVPKSGEIKPAVWYRPKFLSAICKQIGDNILPKLLGIDEAKFDFRKAREYYPMSFSAANEKWLPIDGYSRVKMNDCYGLTCWLMDGKWMLSIPAKRGQCGKGDEYDVTESVTRILKNTGCQGVIERNKNYTVAAEDMIWKLDARTAIAIAEIHALGKKEDAVDTLDIRSSMLLKRGGNEAK